jgi:multidrug efflux system membrane fusion protein
VKGPFVYIANPDHTVTLKLVTTSATKGDDTVVTPIISGQSVVLEGADKLTDGAKITISNEHATA